MNKNKLKLITLIPCQAYNIFRITTLHQHILRDGYAFAGLPEMNKARQCHTLMLFGVRAEGFVAKQCEDYGAHKI